LVDAKATCPEGIIVNTRNLLVTAAAVVCSLATVCALAAGAWSGRTLIERLTVRADQIIVVTKASGSWENPSFCDDDSRIVLLPPRAESGALAYKEVYASLLGAHLTNREINAFLDGCAPLTSGGTTFPVITQVAIY
jgi:hypothetical protein